MRRQLSTEMPRVARESPELCLLGPLELRRAGRLLPVGGAHPRALLALLALHRGMVVSVDRIVDGLWGESPPPTARHMVEVYVSKLRKLLGAEVVETRPPGYLLAVDPEYVDVGRFERLLAEGREALGDGDATVAAAKLADALALWHGPPLADFAYEPFAQAEIARLEELRLLAEEERIEAELELGKGPELIPVLENLVAAAPFRERFRAQLMLALYRAGRQADALAAYRAARETLVEELGVEPSPELRELERAILAQEERLGGRRALAHRLPEARETRRVVTVLFVELATAGPGPDPEALRAATTRSLERAEEVLQRHGATVERAPDETVMAVFGSPVAHEDDVARSLRAAAELRALGLVSRAAVDTGEVLAGGEPVVRGSVVRAAAQLLVFASQNEVLVGELTGRIAASSARFEAADLDSANAWRLVDVVSGATPRPLLLDTPVIGRREELTELSEALARAVRERRPNLVTVVGEAGIGKSRLAREFAEMTKLEAHVLTGRCLAYGEGITYWPLREVISELAPDETVQALEALVAGMADSELIARRLAAVIGLVEEVYPVEEVRWAAHRLFEQLARERPLVLVVEDVQWAEPTFLDLLQHVVEVGRDTPILFLCLARPEVLEERSEWGSFNEPSGIVSLRALSPSEAEELLSRLDPANTLLHDQRAQVLNAAEGNPLFLEQLVAFACEKTTQTDVPPTLQALLAARLDLLGPGERAVVECAAVVGREFLVGAVAQLVPSRLQATLSRHLDALERKELIEPEASTLAFEGAFRFRHVLIQEAAYRSLPKERRGELHERLATWLDGTAAGGGEQDEIVGYHLEQAYRLSTELGISGDGGRGLALRAGEKLSAAGESALRRNDLPAAANLLARATRLQEAADRPRLDLLVDLGAALYWLGEGREALAVLDDALIQARGASEPAVEWRARLTRDYVFGALEPRAGSITRDIHTAEAAVVALEPLGDDRALARAWRLLAQSRLWLGRIESSLEASARALEHARRVGDRQEEAWALRTRGLALWSGPMPAAEAAQACEALLATEPNREIAAHLLCALGGIRAMQGELPDALHLVDSSLAILEELGLTFSLAATLTAYSAQVHDLSGDPAGAEHDLRRALVLFESMGDDGGRSTAAALLAHALADDGRYSAAERYVDTAEALAVADDYITNAKLLSARAKILAGRGAFDEARQAVEDAIAIVDTTDDLDSRGDTRLDEAEVLQLAGDPEAAAASVERAIELLEQKGNVVMAGRARAKLAELHAMAGSR